MSPDEIAAPWAFTGQTRCYDTVGNLISCADSGQDAAHARQPSWPDPRFEARDAVFIDRLTGLEWLRDANPAGFPLDWGEALDFIRQANAEMLGGVTDWRLPNRRELHSLIDYGRHRPALPELPIHNLFQSGYWTSTTAVIHPAHAWTVDVSGGRLFYGGKDQAYLVWPVRGQSPVLAATGQVECFDATGRLQVCPESGQDGATRFGRAWPEPRFVSRPTGVLDRLSGLVWYPRGDLGAPMLWEAALNSVRALEARAQRDDPAGHSAGWRLPSIAELESLVDNGRSGPAIPSGHPFQGLDAIYWSSTTSVYEPDWAWALYLEKGALGVGHKPFAHFSVWPVRTAEAADLVAGSSV